MMSSVRRTKMRCPFQSKHLLPRAVLGLGRTAPLEGAVGTAGTQWVANTVRMAYYYSNSTTTSSGAGLGHRAGTDGGPGAIIQPIFFLQFLRQFGQTAPKRVSSWCGGGAGMRRRLSSNGVQRLSIPLSSHDPDCPLSFCWSNQLPGGHTINCLIDKLRGILVYVFSV